MVTVTDTCVSIRPFCRGIQGSTRGHLARLSQPPWKAALCARVPTDHRGLQVHKHCSGHVLASPGLAEECVERVIPTTDGFVTWHLSIGLNSMFKAVQFPAGIADLHTGLPHVDRNAFSLGKEISMRPTKDINMSSGNHQYIPRKM